MLPLYAARIEDLGPGDFVKVDCAACHHGARPQRAGPVPGVREERKGGGFDQVAATRRVSRYTLWRGRAFVRARDPLTMGPMTPRPGGTSPGGVQVRAGGAARLGTRRGRGTGDEIGELLARTREDVCGRGPGFQGC
jgi:hypothetical protein